MHMKTTLFGNCSCHHLFKLKGKYLGLMATQTKIGILAVQGAFAEHEHCLYRAASTMKRECAALGGRDVTEVLQVRNPSDMDGLDGLVIPGGESTTMAHYLRRNGFIGKISQWMRGKY